MHKETLCGRLYSIEVDVYSKLNEKITFMSHVWGLRNNVRTPTVARWKARGRLYIRPN